MNNDTHVMLDLETMGNTPNAAIVAIGAVEFDPALNQLGRTFYRRISLESSTSAGGTMDASTVTWWLRQGYGARSEVFTPGGQIEHLALVEFTQWLKHFGEDVKIWGNGAGFDNVILGSAYRRHDQKQPWKYSNNRCYRTLKSMIPDLNEVRVGFHHNALDDAMTQAMHAIKLLGQSALAINPLPDSKIEVCDYPDCQCPFDRDDSKPMCTLSYPIACAVNF